MGAILYREWGKMGYSFYALKEHRGIRIAPKPGGFEADPNHAEHAALMKKVRAGEATPEESARFRELHQAGSTWVLEQDPYELYNVDVIDGTPPPRVRGHADQRCEACGEGVSEDCTRRHAGRMLCIPCFEVALVA